MCCFDCYRSSRCDQKVILLPICINICILVCPLIHRLVENQQNLLESDVSVDKKQDNAYCNSLITKGCVWCINTILIIGLIGVTEIINSLYSVCFMVEFNMIYYLGYLIHNKVYVGTDTDFFFF